MISYQEEYFDVIKTPIKDVDLMWYDLFKKHYNEIAWNKDLIPLDPDWEKYIKMGELGFIKIYTARENGLLVGYAIWLVAPSMHYKTTKKALNDILYVDPDKRGGRTGINLIKYSEKMLKELGCKTIGMHIKEVFNWGNVAERLGYEKIESLYEKWVGD